MDKEYQKSMFIFNAIEDGWTVRKQSKKYIFKRKHKNKKEVFMPNFVEEFIDKYRRLCQ